MVHFSELNAQQGSKCWRKWEPLLIFGVLITGKFVFKSFTGFMRFMLLDLGYKNLDDH